MARRKGYKKSEATGFTKMLKPTCKRRGGKSATKCKVWVATKNVAKYTAAGYEKAP